MSDDEAAAAVATDWREAPAEHEALIADELALLMSEHGIRHLDLLPALEQAVARGEAIFPANVDGHFTADGYRVIANEVARRLVSPAPCDCVSPLSARGRGEVLGSDDADSELRANLGQRSIRVAFPIERGPALPHAERAQQGAAPVERG